jgi:hypothetical protein
VTEKLSVGFAPHPASYPVGTEASLPPLMGLSHALSHAPMLSLGYAYTVLYISMSRSLIKDRDNYNVST